MKKGIYYDCNLCAPTTLDRHCRRNPVFDVRFYFILEVQKDKYVGFYATLFFDFIGQF